MESRVRSMSLFSMAPDSARVLRRGGSVSSAMPGRKSSGPDRGKRASSRADLVSLKSGSSILAAGSHTTLAGSSSMKSRYGMVEHPVQSVVVRKEHVSHALTEMSKSFQPLALEQAKRQAAYIASRQAKWSQLHKPFESAKVRRSFAYASATSQHDDLDIVQPLEEYMPTKTTPGERRRLYRDISSSLTKVDHLMRTKKDLDRIPWDKQSNLLKVPTPAANRVASLCNASLYGDIDVKKGASDSHILVTTNQQMKDFQRGFYRRVQEAAIRRRALRMRKKWLTGYRKAQTVLTIYKNMAVRSAGLEMLPRTYVDVGDMATASINYGGGRSVDTEHFKARKEICISSRAKDILNSNPSDRTLLQLEDARRELQKVEVYSEYPIEAQEQLLKHAFYLTIGPKRIIVRNGQYPEYFYIIICGEAYAKKKDVDPVTGEVQVSAAQFLKRGQVFGGGALTEGRPHIKTVISRTNMQLLAIQGDDYLDVFWYPTLKKEPPPYIVFLSNLSFMDGFPMDLLKERLDVCTMHHFRRNTVITHDSKASHSLYIIKFGYCKVFRKLDWKDQKDDPYSRSAKSARKKSDSFLTGAYDDRYIESDSTYVSYYSTLSPAGHPVRVPVTKIPRPTERIQHIRLSVPGGKRKFVPLMLLREGDVFGLDQTPVCPSQHSSRAVILVSLGAEVIALNKNFYCRHMSHEAADVVDRTFIYDDAFIRRRLRERVNRDVHLEEVLKHYFAKLDMADIEQDDPNKK